jgi:hypothetical protein
LQQNISPYRTSSVGIFIFTMPEKTTTPCKIRAIQRQQNNFHTIKHIFISKYFAVSKIHLNFVPKY